MTLSEFYDKMKDVPLNTKIKVSVPDGDLKDAAAFYFDDLGKEPVIVITN